MDSIKWALSEIQLFFSEFIVILCIFYIGLDVVEFVELAIGPYILLS